MHSRLDHCEGESFEGSPHRRRGGFLSVALTLIGLAESIAKFASARIVFKLGYCDSAQRGGFRLLFDNEKK